MPKEVHALITGPVVGFIPTPSKAITGDYVDVTEPVLFFDSLKEAEAVAAAISDRHKALGDHPEDETGAH